MGKVMNAYLVMYNTACLIGWGVALVRGIEAAIATDDLGAVWTAVGAAPLSKNPPTTPPPPPPKKKNKMKKKTGPALGDIVFLVQWAMTLEILHAVLGLVRSPVFVTAMQVTSRLWIVMVPFVDGTSELATALGVGGLSDCGIGGKWCVGLMVLSWAAVEVVRYTFYLCALLFAKVPYPVFWLRYSAFALLYPTGITGELLTAQAGLACFSQQGAASPLLATVAQVIVMIMVMYIPGSPFMYMNMVGNRKSAFKKRFAPPPKPPRGCQFPRDAKGLRSTTVPNKACIAAALRPCDGKAAAKCLAEKKYRFAYAGHYKTLVELGCYSPQNALNSAKGGLAYLYENFEFVDENGVVRTFGQAVRPGATVTTSGRILATEIVRGTARESAAAAAKKRAYVVPYDGGWHPTRPRAPAAAVEKDDLTALTAKWARAGVVEQDAAEAINWTSNYFEAGGSLANAYFVLIGAGSAMGPCAKLLEHGANVVALDIPGAWGKGGPRPASKLWDRLLALAAESSGTLTVPVPEGSTGKDAPLAERAGADLINEPREIADWLCDVWLPSLPRDAKIAIGNYTYLDGELHVKLALCADAIIDRVLAQNRALNFATPAACCFLCTPTDAHVVPPDVARAAKLNYASRGLVAGTLERLVHALTLGAKLRPNFSTKKIPTADGGEAFVCDGLSVAQGPNYALAKRMQHWRACVAFDQGHTVSSMVAPSTATVSVIHNKTFAWAYGGMPAFGFEIFKQETTNAVMFGVLVHDVLNPDGPKAPKNAAKFGIKNTLQIFSTESVHGGLWRSPYAVDSLGEVSALLYFCEVAKPAFLALGLLAAGAAYLAVAN